MFTSSPTAWNPLINNALSVKVSPFLPEFGLSNSPFSFDNFDIKRGFLGQETICGHGCHEIRGKPSDAPVARVFNLNDVLQFVVYRLDQRPFPQ